MQVKDYTKHPQNIVTELEMCSLAINIGSSAHPLRKVDFDAVLDHIALEHIIKRKVEPATTSI